MGVLCVTYKTSLIMSAQSGTYALRFLGFADEIVQLHAEGIGDPREHSQRWVAVAALDLLQGVLVNASKFRDDAAG